MQRFHMDDQAKEAAKLVAEASLTYSSIADRVGVTRQTILNWRRQPLFVEEVEAIREGIRLEAHDYGLSIRENRITALNDRWNRLRKVIEDRADDPEHQIAPGGSTGLLVRQTKGVGRGDDFTLIHEFAVDVGLLAELRAVEQQAAKELGQWTDKKEVQHSGDMRHAVALDLTTLSTDQLRAIRDISGELAKSRPG